MCTEKVKIKLFVTYCSQFYCAHLWKFNRSDKKYNKLRVAYNNVFRFLLSLPRDEEGRPCSASEMFVTRRVKSFEEILRNVVFRFQSRLKLSTNDLVCSALNTNEVYKSMYLYYLHIYSCQICKYFNQLYCNPIWTLYTMYI